VRPDTLCEQEQAADLGELESLQRLGAALELVEPFDLLVRFGDRGSRVVVFGRNAGAFALLAQCERSCLTTVLSQGTRSEALVVG
jgi:hypothetical protein